jgi:predicted acetyltransferase
LALPKNEVLTNACPFLCFFKHLLFTAGQDAFFLISQHQRKETGDKIICRLFLEKEIVFSVTYFV